MDFYKNNEISNCTNHCEFLYKVSELGTFKQNPTGYYPITLYTEA
jgi:hypothetical protein